MKGIFLFRGHQAVLRRNGKYKLLDPAPLVLIKSVMDLMPQVTRWIMMLAARIMMLAPR